MLPITERLISKNRPFRKLAALKAVIIHWTANLNKGANAYANARYFDSDQYLTKKNGEKVKISASAHYVVDDKQIIQCIPDNEVGYHVGSKSGYKPLVYEKIGVPAGGSPNNYTIGIEICVNVDSDFVKARQNAIELTHYLLQKHNLQITDVYRHYDITGKDCPRMMLDEAIWNQFISEVAHYDSTDIKLRVNASVLNVRAGCGTDYPVTRKLSKDDIVSRTGQNGLWYQIGENEWVHSSYVLIV